LSWLPCRNSQSDIHDPPCSSHSVTLPPLSRQL
jgi:hypothetical protein